MLISKVPPDDGVCFAWKFIHTREGTVWLEFVSYEKVGDDVWRYRRIPSFKRAPM